MLVMLVAFLSGMLSVLTPCVLPLLPAILASSADGGRRRPIGIVVGVATSFTIALVAFAELVDLLGIPSDTLRWFAAALLVTFGAVLLVPALKARFERLAGRLARFAPSGERGGDGFLGGLLLGAGLGVVWAPCVGPILAGVAVASQTSTTGGSEVVRAVAFALGMSIPLLAIVFGGRAVVGRLRGRIDPRRIQFATGAIFVLTGLLIATGLDTRVNRWLSETTGVSSTLIADFEADVLERDAPDRRFAGSGHGSADGELQELGRAPRPRGIAQWLNTPDEQPLTRSDLRGKVVLYDFWTYSCINCLRTLPYLRRWHEQYADDGLVLLGVHAPEFEFERDEGNVRSAVDDLDIEYPVALDNDFETWRAFDNQYWPAKYLVDREGEVRYTHFGEGDYDETEAAIRELLGLGELERGNEPAEQNLAATAETYVGYERTRGFRSVPEGEREPNLVPDQAARYEAPTTLERDTWALGGTWTMEAERAIAGEDAVITLRYRAADVFLVLGPTRGSGARVTVRDSAPDGRTRRIRVDREDLYVLRDTDVQRDGTVTIEVPPGIAAYAFTFG